jgi:hypothetical protein
VSPASDHRPRITPARAEGLRLVARLAAEQVERQGELLFPGERELLSCGLAYAHELADWYDRRRGGS